MGGGWVLEVSGWFPKVVASFSGLVDGLVFEGGGYFFVGGSWVLRLMVGGFCGCWWFLGN